MFWFQCETDCLIFFNWMFDEIITAAQTLDRIRVAAIGLAMDYIIPGIPMPPMPPIPPMPGMPPMPMSPPMP